MRFSTGKAWRPWLAKHLASSPGIWFTFYKAPIGRKLVAYENMVRGALCFGWIDSLIKRIDDECYTIKVTPRQTGSKWSGLNREAMG
jgi:uncharacterized protein YdeI (YjbR/CyaY-like superfamily)